jgi:DNA polymerase-1
MTAFAKTNISCHLYFTRYPGVKNYMDTTRELARRQGYVETLFGRRLYLPEIASRNAARRQYAERTAINAPMQGTAAGLDAPLVVDIGAGDNWDEAH